jgi:UDP-glucose 4-epimerase
VRVLVTGAGTPLGRGLIIALAHARDVEHIIGIGPRSSIELAAPASYQQVELSHAREIHDLVWQAAHRHAIDTVVHLGHDAVPAGQLVRSCAEHPTIRRLVYRSFGGIYALDRTAGLLDEDTPFEASRSAPGWLRERVKADLTVASHLGGTLQIAVLRLAELMAPDCDSPLWDYLSSGLCLRPLGFDPMLNVLSIADAVDALAAAIRSSQCGVFNIPGAETLPLSSAIVESQRVGLPLPGVLLGPLYGLRRWAASYHDHHDHHDHRQLLDLRQLRFGGVLDGTRARDRLGYVPRHPACWPRPWWRGLTEQLAAAPGDGAGDT